jgi:putative NADH-flavin reductase
MARLLIFGATGGTGKELVTLALERGHDVTAFVRDPSKLAVTHAHLRIQQGDLKKPETIRAVIPNHQAVLSALGTRTLGKSTLLSDGLKEIIASMTASGVRRLLWESSLGVGATRGQLGPLYDWILVPLLLRNAFADKERQEQMIRSSTLDWTIVQPAALTNGPGTEKYRVGPDACRERRFPRISRADVAHFMLAEIEAPKYVRQSVALCY